MGFWGDVLKGSEGYASGDYLISCGNNETNLQAQKSQ